MTRLPGFVLSATTALAVAGLSAAALAAPEHHRVRGTVVSVSPTTLVVHPATGSDVSVAIGPDTKYATVVKSDLGQVDKDSYIGTATKSVGDQLVALEVVIFPAAMRGAGDGHYDWDTINDPTMSGHASASSMTNGNVDATTDKSGAKQIVVSYKGGKQTIVVPPTAPIVAFEPAEMSAVKKGATVFVNGTEDGGKVVGRFVAIGTPGANPPM